jgi:phosphoglycerol transferase MdoB-like AlkP superfamily enzyme
VAAGAKEAGLRAVCVLTLVLTLILLAFYLGYGYYVMDTKNYGGWTSGPRWFFWLTPFWLVAMIPAADWAARFRLARLVGYLALGVSALSAAYAAWNPWRHPWLYNLLESLDLIRY